TLRALATALLREKKIQTTLAKAKETRMFVEPIITRAKNDCVAARRIVARDIHDKEVVKELFNEIVPKIGDRPGGYTRVVKLGQRLGDAAEMAIIELVDYNDIVERKKPRKAKTEDAKVVEETVEEKTVEDTEVVNEVEVEETEEVVEEAVDEAEEIVEETVEEISEEVKEDTTEKAEEKIKEVKEEETSEAKAEETNEEAKPEDESNEEEKKEDK
ncbi:MAG: 50S ribosomal protein L17, partial [Chlorobi bacterium]|nr:50S ribosomal protein L17 [Chlorobiota bacterium]